MEYVAKNGARRGQRSQKDLGADQNRCQEQNEMEDSCGSPMSLGRLMGFINKSYAGAHGI